MFDWLKGISPVYVPLGHLSRILPPSDINLQGWLKDAQRLHVFSQCWPIHNLQSPSSLVSFRVCSWDTQYMAAIFSFMLFSFVLQSQDTLCTSNNIIQSPALLFPHSNALSSFVTYWFHTCMLLMFIKYQLNSPLFCQTSSIFIHNILPNHLISALQLTATWSAT